VPLGFVSGILIGGLVGFLNGVLITRLRLPPFIATLGTLSVAGGVALLVTNGEAVYGLPPSFNELGGGTIGPIPVPVVILAGVAIFGYFILGHTTLGRSAYAIGSNPETARLSGINIERTLLLIYVIQGLLAGLGGVIDASRVTIGPPLGGTNYNLQAIAAAVIGGASLFGGEGSILGALIGALLIELIANGSDLLNVSTFWQQVILGIVIVLAVVYDQVRRRALAGR
jgi:ribose transport system permease protein